MRAISVSTRPRRTEMRKTPQVQLQCWRPLQHGRSHCYRSQIEKSLEQKEVRLCSQQRGRRTMLQSRKNKTPYTLQKTLIIAKSNYKNLRCNTSRLFTHST